MSKPLPCPFCGSKAEITRLSGPVFNVSCITGDPEHFEKHKIMCGVVMYGDHGETKASVIDRWNRRAKQ